MNRIVLIAFLAMTIFSMQGCAALFVYGKETKEIRSASGPGDTNTSSFLRRNWGEPTSIKVIINNQSEEIWTYESGTIWGGVMPILVILPIPLRIPVGKEKIEYHLKNEQVVRTTETKASERFGGFFLFSPDGPFYRPLQ